MKNMKKLIVITLLAGASFGLRGSGPIDWGTETKKRSAADELGELVQKLSTHHHRLLFSVCQYLAPYLEWAEPQYTIVGNLLNDPNHYYQTNTAYNVKDHLDNLEDCIHTSPIKEHSILELRTSPDLRSQRHVVVQGQDVLVHEYDATRKLTGDIIGRLVKHIRPIECIIWPRDYSDHLVSSSDKEVVSWRAWLPNLLSTVPKLRNPDETQLWQAITTKHEENSRKAAQLCIIN